jgi:transcriptional regulator with XRE-family HTH domain
LGVSDVTFADKLKQLREKAGQSREQLAQTSGLARGTVRDYEQGKRKPTLESAVQLARALGVGVEVLADCTDNGAAAGGKAKSARKPAAGAPKPTKPQPKK